MFNLDCQPEMEPNEHVAELGEIFNSSYNKVREKMDVAHERQREYYSQKVHGTPYQVGDRVWLHSTVTPKGKSKKLNHPWTGPYLVVKRLSDVNYRIQHQHIRNKRSVVHFDRLKPCNPNTRFPEQHHEQITQGDSGTSQQPCHW